MPRISVGEWFNDLITFLNDNLSGLFDFIRTVLQHCTEWIQDGLTYPPTFFTIGILVILAWWLRGPGLAVFSAIAFLLIDSIEQWDNTMDTTAVVLVATIIGVVIAIPVGIAAARNNTVSAIVRPILDFLQTMPAFVYLLPALAFFGIGLVPGVVATLVFAIAPGVRLTELGIRQVDREMVEAGEAFGSSRWKILTGIQIPLALKTIMTGINQVIMLALSMVVIAGFVGAGGLGAVVYLGISQQNYGIGFEGGIAVVILAVYLDRTTSALGDRIPARARLAAKRTANGPLLKYRLRPAAAVSGVAVVALAGSLLTAFDAGSDGEKGSSANMQLVQSSTAAMLSQLKKSIDEKKPIAVTLWHPHWAYQRYPIKDLKDPRGAWGQAESLHTLAHKGFASSEPQVAKWIKRMKWDGRHLQSLENEINQAGTGHEADGVKAWLKDPANKKYADAMIGDTEEQLGSGKTIKIGYIPWDEDIALTNLWKIQLQRLGFQVKTTSLDIGPLFTGLARGDIDMFFDAWLPTLHKTYFEKNKKNLEDLGVWYKSADLGIAVPTYVKDVNTLDDLREHADEFNNQIVGIEPGAGEMEKVKSSIMPKYGLNGQAVSTGSGSDEDVETANMQLVQSSTPAMLSQLGKSIDEKKPIVVTLWHPHWAYQRYDIRDLKDPKGAWGKPDSMHTLAHKGFSDSEPQVAAWLKKMRWNSTRLQSLEDEIHKAGTGHEAEGAGKWIQDPKNKRFAQGLIGNTDEQIGSGKRIRIGYIPWDEDIALTNVWKILLEQLGFQVKVTSLDVGPLYTGLARGDVDLFFDASLPTLHKSYYEKNKNELEDLGVSYKDMDLGLAVPDYVKDVRTIDDLREHADEFNNRIIGIEPGAGEMEKVKSSIMTKYKLSAQ